MRTRRWWTPAAAWMIALVAATVWADEPSAPRQEVDRDAPDFVTASLLVMGPGDELYSCAGHAALRMECPTYGLDYSFSYESESVKDKVLTFFRGKLKMGMFAVPTEEYLKLGRESGRGVMQYQLNLPPDAKQRLWQLLDEKVAEGPCLEYDYMKRGCAQAAMSILLTASRPYVVEVNPWPERYDEWSRSDFLAAATKDYPWQQFILYTICGATNDEAMPNFEKVVIPSDLLEILQIATINGTPISDGKGVELLPLEVKNRPRPLCMPFVVSWLAMALAFVNFFIRRAWLDGVFLAFQSVLGVFLTYMVCFSNLTAVGWNWLIVPFNPLPAVFWKWRRKWALGFALLLLVWVAAMALAPHRMTDPAYLVLVTAYAVFYLSLWKQPRIQERHP